MTRIPLDAIGYSVNPNTGTIHTRYADHGNGARTRTAKGVETLLDGQKPKACKLCYPSPRYPEPPRPPQKRRVLTWAQPAEIEVDDVEAVPGS
jgi:hypothetical protein